VDCEGIGAISRDRLKDGIGRLGPDKGLWVGNMGLDEGDDVCLELMDTAMGTALDLPVGEQREPAFDLVQPGGAGRCKVEVIARMAGEPSFPRNDDECNKFYERHRGEVVGPNPR
jgi:hypothetical protein